MKKKDNSNNNIARAALAFTSVTLLKGNNLDIAEYQKRGIELYACYDLLHKNFNVNILQEFKEIYNKNEKSQIVFEKCEFINQYGIFYPILIQELIFLSSNIIRKINRQEVHKEVTNLINYLENVAKRDIGDDIGQFRGKYCKFAIILIGKRINVELERTEIYWDYLKKIYLNNNTIYFLGNFFKKKFIKGFF